MTPDCRCDTIVSPHWIILTTYLKTQRRRCVTVPEVFWRRPVPRAGGLCSGRTRRAHISPSDPLFHLWDDVKWLVRPLILFFSSCTFQWALWAFYRRHSVVITSKWRRRKPENGSENQRKTVHVLWTLLLTNAACFKHLSYLEGLDQMEEWSPWLKTPWGVT